MKAIYKDFIGIYENAYPKEYCDYLMNVGIKNLNPKNTLLRDKNVGLQMEDSALPLDKFISKKSFKFFDDVFYKIFEQYIKRYRCLNEVVQDGMRIMDFKFQKTKPSQGYHIFHCEHSMNFGFFWRWGVWTLYLNDIEEGGETEFLYQSTRIKPKAGTLCVFPAYYTHTHRGNPPLLKDKYIVTGWLGYPEKQVHNALINPNQKSNNE